MVTFIANAIIGRSITIEREIKEMEQYNYSKNVAEKIKQYLKNQ